MDQASGRRENQIRRGGTHDDHVQLRGLNAGSFQRARGGVGLIVTGGIAPNEAGRPMPGGAAMTSQAEADKHRVVTQAVHDAGGKICMQILHFGRYAYHPQLVAPSALKAPISPFAPKALTTQEVQQTVEDYANAAALAQSAGYDGVEIMGSEGYLINEFIAAQTNQRDDEYGGSYENRIRFALEIVRRTRARVGQHFIIIFRLSMLDLVEGGSTQDEVVQLAQALEAAGVTILNTGIGWHEARIPTIATKVPRAAFAWVTEQLKGKVGIPLVTTNRINTPDVAENILASGQAASTFAVLNIAEAGDHFVASSSIYGGTYNLFEHTFPNYGIETTFVDPTKDTQVFEDAIKDNTRIVYIESVGNPNANLIDIEAVAAIVTFLLLGRWFEARSKAKIPDNFPG